MTKAKEVVQEPVDPVVEPVVEEAVENLQAPTGPSFAASTSNIAYDKVASNKLGALCTGMGYAPDVDVATTKATQYIGGAAETISYSAPSPQKS